MFAVSFVASVVETCSKSVRGHVLLEVLQVFHLSVLSVSLSPSRSHGIADTPIVG